MASLGAAVVVGGEPENNAPTAVIETDPDPAVVQLAGGAASVVLSGAMSSDGDGGTQGLQFRWEKLSGPEGDTIDEPDADRTEVVFTAPGAFEYRLTVDDGQAANSQDSERVVVTVLSEPIPVDILYNFEGDSGSTATDKLDEDGVIDGTLQNNVAIVSDDAPFGSQAARFTEPDLFSTIEIPGSESLGAAWTIAAHGRYRNKGFTRIFSSFRGTGRWCRSRPYGLRPERRRDSRHPCDRQQRRGRYSRSSDFREDEYNHFAVRYDDGDVTIFVNGEPVATGNVGAGPIEMTAPLRFGEDPHDGGGSANEQFVGNVDEILVLGRALSDIDISTLASAGVRANLERADTLGIHYSFEPDDAGTTITDHFVMDGAQDGIVRGDVLVDEDVVNAFAGDQSGVLSPLGAAFSVIDVGALGNVGDQLTMAAVVNVPGGGFSAGGLTRLFSTYPGGGSPAGRLIFDFDPNASVESIGMRVILPNGNALTSDATFSVDEPHHLAMVYSDGAVRLFLDGQVIASGDGAGGDVDFGEHLVRVGEDLAGAANENLQGIVDDVLILGDALSAEEVEALAAEGADRIFGLTAPNNAPTASIATVPDPAEVTLVDGMSEVMLDGSASDDGDGGSQGLTYSWEKVSGPADDTISAPADATTTVSFSADGEYVYRLRVDDGQSENNSDSAEVTVFVLAEPAPRFIRGDANSDGEVNITDVLFSLNFLFAGGASPRCLDAADASDEGSVVITSPIYLLNYLFAGGPAPPPPSPGCGVDPTEDELAECETSEVCRL